MPEIHIATVVKDFATACAIIAGGGWALWKWTYGEMLRKRREMASPDGTLSVTALNLDDEISALTLHALWRNRGSLAIDLCAEHTGVELFQIVEPTAEGRLQLRPNGNVKRLSVAAPTWKVYVMEPNTDSVMHEHFLLRRGFLYGFRWTICLLPGSIPGVHKKSHLACTRELLWRSDQSIREKKASSEDSA